MDRAQRHSGLSDRVTKGEETLDNHSTTCDRDDDDPWSELGSANFYLHLPEYVTRQPVGDTATPNGCNVPDGLGDNDKGESE